MNQPVQNSNTGNINWILRRLAALEAQLRRLQQALRELGRSGFGGGSTELTPCVIRVTSGPVGPVAAPAWTTITGVVQTDGGASPYADGVPAVMISARYDWGRVVAAGEYVKLGVFNGVLWAVDLAQQAPGAYGFLAAGASITAASGSTLGNGTVTLCTRTGGSLNANLGTATVYNAGGAVSGGASGKYVKLGWAADAWSLDVASC